VPMHMTGSAQSYDGEWIMTITDGLVTKIERFDPGTATCVESSANEHDYQSGSIGAFLFGVLHRNPRLRPGNSVLGRPSRSSPLPENDRILQRYGPDVTVLFAESDIGWFAGSEPSTSSGMDAP